MVRERFSSFDAFWPAYVREHSKKETRTAHFVGTTAALGCAATGLLGKKRLLLLAPLLGYGGAFLGHALFEKNRPLTFKHPLYSLAGDLKMWWLTVNGRMDAEANAILSKPEGDDEGQTPLEDDGGKGHVEIMDAPEDGRPPSKDQLN